MSLLRLALLFCPREFREQYAAQICEDQRTHGGSALTAAFDTLMAGWAMRLEGVSRDISLALRTLIKERTFTATAIFAIAIATAANVALAGVVNGVLLQPLPFPQSSRLAFVDVGPTASDTLSYPELRDFSERATTIQSIGISHRDTAAFQRGGVSIGLQGRQIAGKYFETFGLRPQLGRFLTPSDLGKALVVISDATWRRYYEADRSVIGTRMRLGGQSYTIVGVAPGTFRDPRPSGLLTPAYWIPVNPSTSGCIDRGCHAYVAVARLRDGATVASTSADAARVTRAIAVGNPTYYMHNAGSAHSVLDAIVGPVRWLLWLLYAAALLVLLIACANVANLQLVRAALREGQIAMYLALGASRARVVRQLSTESAILATIGGVLGLGLAFAALRAFGFAGAALLPRWETVSLDWHVALYAIVVIVFITALTGTVPAIVFARDAARSLRSAGKSSDRKGRATFRAALVCAEIALAFALTVSAGLTLRSFVSLTHTNVGFNGDRLYDAYFGFLPDARYGRPEARRDFGALAQQAIAQIPGIASATVSNGAPFADENSTSLQIAGQPPLPLEVDLYTVDPSFFRTMQIPILRGRGIAPADTGRSMPVIVLNAAAARRYFGSLDVLGRIVTPGMCGDNRPRCARTIVGVVGDTRDSFASPPTPTTYVPLAQMPIIAHVFVRMKAGTPLPAAAITHALLHVDPLLVPPTITPFREIFRQDSIGSETASLFFAGFAFIALVLALAGVYAVTAFSVAARTREFGIRKAVGATDSSVLRNVVSHAALQAVGGGVAGLLLTAACSQLLAGLLYRISPMDVPTFAVVFVLLLGCSVAAAIVPAMRATRIPPARALRYE